MGFNYDFDGITMGLDYNRYSNNNGFRIIDDDMFNNGI